MTKKNIMEGEEMVTIMPSNTVREIRWNAEEVFQEPGELLIGS
jgi:hypothetical protein